MLPNAMQELIKAKAARKAAEFKDPYKKRTMSKEEFLAEKQRGAPAAMDVTVTGGAAPSVDVSALLQGQQQILRQLQQLAEDVRRLGVGGGGGGGSEGGADMTAELDKLKREMRQSQRQATDDMLSQVESIVRDAMQNKAEGSSSSTSDAEVSRLKREITQLKTDVADLKEENEALRKQQQAAARAAPAPAPAPAPARSSPAPAPSRPAASPRASTGQMEVTETNSAYELKLDIPGAKTSDLKISYGSGALELEAKGKKYSFEVDASLIDPSGISAMLQPNGGLQITVPKKK